MGFLHGIVPGRESLVLDLIEPLRPSVDACVLALLHDVLTPHDFTSNPQTGCRLDKNGRAAFFRVWSQLREGWPDLLLDLHADGTAAAPAGSIAQTALSAQCRRVTNWLRARLGAAADTESSAGEQGD